MDDSLRNGIVAGLITGVIAGLLTALIIVPLLYELELPHWLMPQYRAETSFTQIVITELSIITL